MRAHRLSVLTSVVFLGVIVFNGCIPPAIPEGTSARPTDALLRLASDLGTPTLTPFLPITNTPSNTPSPTSTGTFTPTPTLTPSPTPRLTSTPPPTSTPTLKPEARITGISGKWPTYSLSCEARSAVDWARFFGVAITEVAFQEALPVSDDPDLGFVGDVNAPWGQIPPNPYGVHAEPVAALLQEYGLSALARRGMTLDELRAEISAGRPVIVWVVGRVGRGTPVPYVSSAGKETTVVRFEHTVMVIGYSESEITVLDGNWIYSRPVKDFLDSWGTLGNMAVVWAP